MSRNILITGGTGFIGQSLTSMLVKGGDVVTVLTRDADKARRLLGDQVQYLETLPRASEWPFDTVINLAGENLFDRRWTSSRKQALIDSRVELTKALVAVINESGRSVRLISGSAIGYYGNRGDERLTEGATPGDDFQSELCRSWEHAALAADPERVNLAIVRIGVVMGAGGALGRMLPMFKLGLGGRIGSGRQYFSWVHMKDLVAMLIWLVDKPQLTGAFNATAPNPVRNQTFTKALGGVLSRPSFLPVPAFVLKLAMGESSDLLLGGQCVFPERTLANGFEFQFPEISAALQECTQREQ